MIGLEEIIRICGKNLLHLPPEYAPSPLVVPTCVRATAHYLVENGMWWHLASYMIARLTTDMVSSSRQRRRCLSRSRFSTGGQRAI